ncbi:MAG: diacylglycerol kinase family protein [Candidatus Magasanikbacteria bacterium]
MYVYLYDNFLKHKRYTTVLQEVETKLTDYGIAGKIIRLQHYASAEILVEDEIRRGAKTVVIVGNDTTFGHVLSRAATSKVTYGFLPIGSENSIAQVLGVPVGVEACDALARRRKLLLDVGWVNNRYFISQLHIPPSNIDIEYDERFVVSSKSGQMELVVCNLKPFVWSGKGREYVVHPQDGKLEAFIRPVVKKGIFRKEIFEEPSIFPFEEMVVSSKIPFPVETDGKISKEVKIKIKLAKSRIEMIVGKGRKF